MVTQAERGGSARFHAGRGLCQMCMQWCVRHDTVEDYPRRTYANADLLAEAEMLMGAGCSRAQAAERLGIKDHSLRSALSRARRRQRQDA